MRVACVDIGTLTCRLLVADVHLPNKLKELDAARRILRLGEGVDQHKHLSVEAMNRVLATLIEWKKKTDRYSLDSMAVVATSAVRDAENRQEFLRRVKQETGWEIELLTGEEEARRAMLGIRFGLPSRISDFVGLDIGGGSTECILAQGQHSPAVVSLELGVVRLLERVFHHDPPSVDDMQKAKTCIDEQIGILKQSFGEFSNIPLVGTAGTITTLAAIAQQLKQYDRTRVHNYELTFDVIKKIEQDLMTKTGAERLSMPGLEPGREFVIIAGTVILRQIMESFNFSSCLVSDYGLREGILVDLATKNLNL